MQRPPPDTRHPTADVMNRRDFLHPRQFTQAAGPVLGALNELTATLPPPPSPTPEVALWRLSHRAMATTFEMLLPFGTPHTAELSGTVFELVDRLEAQLTVYRGSSGAGNLYRLAPYAPALVEERLFGLLQLPQRLTSATRGPLAGAARA